MVPEAIRMMDEGSYQLMIDRMQAQLDAQAGQIEEQAGQIEEQAGQIEEQAGQIEKLQDANRELLQRIADLEAEQNKR